MSESDTRVAGRFGGAGSTLAIGSPEEGEQELEQELSLAFAPLHKRCFGVALGVAAGALLFAATLVHLARSPQEEYPLALLRQYFWGYSVSLPGALAGAFWGFWLGFVIGWFFAFCRNVVLAVTVFFVRARAELAQTRGFLDHI